MLAVVLSAGLVGMTGTSSASRGAEKVETARARRVKAVGDFIVGCGFNSLLEADEAVDYASEWRFSSYEVCRGLYI